VESNVAKLEKQDIADYNTRNCANYGYAFRLHGAPVSI
jgi:hypothetical protein